MRYDDGECIYLSRPSTGSHDIDFATIRNFAIALVITTALMLFFFHKSRAYILTPPSTQGNSSWEGQGQERYPLNIVSAADGGIENPVFEPCEDTPMETEVEDELTS
nr:unnamed protein product [Haemonchus contortus]